MASYYKTMQPLRPPILYGYIWLYITFFFIINKNTQSLLHNNARIIMCVFYACLLGLKILESFCLECEVMVKKILKKV